MEAPYSSQAFSGCAVADEQVEWVLVRVPVRSSGPSSFTSTPPMVDSSFPPYPPHPTTMWDQLPAGPLSPMPLTDPFPGQLESNIALALSLQASYPLACFDTDTSSSPVFHTGDLMPPCDTPFSDVFTSEAWQPAEQYISDTCSLDSPTTAASGTPCSTPPSPQTFLCSDPTCFEFFTRPADLKYDDPPSSSKSQVLTKPPSRRHERKHRQNFRCELCGKAHTDRRALNRHLESKHEEYAIQQGIKSEKVRCRMCDYVSRADNVRRHERSQHASLR